MVRKAILTDVAKGTTKQSDARKPKSVSSRKPTKRAGRDDLLGIIEAAYAIEAEERQWLRGLATSVFELGNLHTIGAYAQRYTLSPDGSPSFGALELVGGDVAALTALHDELGAYYATRPERIAATYGETDEGLALSLPGGERAEIAAILSARGVGDMYGINARSPTGDGCLLCVYLPLKHRPISDERRAAFAHIARHVATALRLRKRLDLAPAAPEARFDAKSGALEHASGEAAATTARKQLVSAAETLVRIRRRRSEYGARSVEAWKGLVDARWSLLDWFDSDGTSYIVAHRNDPSLAPLALLTERERQVVDLAALGLGNKMIAYELGIATSTVGVLVGRAVARLNVRSRQELIRRVCALRAHPPPDASPNER